MEGLGCVKGTRNAWDLHAKLRMELAESCGFIGFLADGTNYARGESRSWVGEFIDRLGVPVHREAHGVP